jgi:hypothetical protein
MPPIEPPILPADGHVPGLGANQGLSDSGIRLDEVDREGPGAERHDPASIEQNAAKYKSRFLSLAKRRDRPNSHPGRQRMLQPMAALIEVVGWLGALAVLAAYGLVSTERVSSRSWSYQLLNITGAVGLVVNSSWNGAIPSAVVNLIWIGIGVYALASTRRQQT